MDGRHPVAQSPMRSAIARRMTYSKTSTPHFYLSSEIEMNRALAELHAHNEGRSSEERLSVTAMLIKAVAMTLSDHPMFNAVWNGDILERVDSVNVGVAIALPDGLIAPAVLGCEALGIDDLGRALDDLVQRTRAGRLRAPEVEGGTFTLSNLGMYGVTAFTAIITPPQVAILATGRTESRPVVRDDAIVVRQMMTATLSSDHRAVDGAAAARFLDSLRGWIEAPDSWIGTAG
jgi:pyruvate dehydrogenase E2 component (dihydrolipoamide acetyltransferase)